LDPGIIATYPSAPAPDCSTPHVAPGQPDWSEVVCGVGANRYVVPPNVHRLKVDVFGAAGGSGGGGAPGGAGEQIKTTIIVTPGELLEMAVGGAGYREAGGFNGGGDGPRLTARGATASGGGGGSSDVRVGDTGVWNRIISAAGGGGGGGAAATGHPAGGNGARNGLVGQTGPGALGGAGGQPATWRGSGAGGGTASGGTGATAGTAGSAVTLVGGTGGTGAGGSGDGGGGGGGYGFGGGGAGGAAGPGTAASGGGGGGGGSSYVDPQWLPPGTPVLHLAGVATGDGSIVITYHAPPIQCGQTIYASMRLTTDLRCETGPGLVLDGVGGDEVDQPIVLDLAGHGIYGGADGVGVTVSQHEATVENGTIRGFQTAVATQLTDGQPFDHEGIALTVSHLTVRASQFGVVSIGGAISMTTAIDHSVFTDLGAESVQAFSDTGLLTVTDSTFTDSADGIDTQSLNVVLRGDLFSDLGFWALNAFSDSVDLEQNTVLGTGGGLVTSSLSPGVDASAPDQAALTITGNTVRGTAGSGIDVSGGAAPGSVLSGNHVVGAGTGVNPGEPAFGNPTDQDGILVELDPSSAANLTVTANTVRGNVAWGIDAVGVTDGGGNVASGNLAGEDCRGVVCTAS
jgi:hypothetical protein